MDEAERERKRIAEFLRAVFEASTHGASSLMERAIKAVETNHMDNILAVARPGESDEIRRWMIDHAREEEGRTLEAVYGRQG